jgi:hypothetical protein
VSRLRLKRLKGPKRALRLKRIAVRFVADWLSRPTPSSTEG